MPRVHPVANNPVVVDPAVVTKDFCDYHRKNPHINILKKGEFMEPNGRISRVLKHECDKNFPRSPKSLASRLTTATKRLIVKNKQDNTLLSLRNFVKAYKTDIYQAGVPKHITFKGKTYKMEEVAYVLFVHGFNIDVEGDDKQPIKVREHTFTWRDVSDLEDELNGMRSLPSRWQEDFVDVGRQYQIEPESHIVKSYKQEKPSARECQKYRDTPERDPRFNVPYVNENDQNYIREKCAKLFRVDHIVFQGRTYSNEQVERIIIEHHLSGETDTPLIKYINKVYPYSWVAELKYKAREYARKSRSSSKPTPSASPSSVSSQPLPEDDHRCMSIFKDALEVANSPFSDTLKKMVKRCTKVVEKCESTHSIRRKLAGNLREYKARDVIEINVSNNALQEIFQRKLLRFKNLTYIPTIHYSNQVGMGISMFTDLINRCIQAATHLFSPIIEGSSRYVVNPEMSPKYASQLGYGDNLTEDDVCKLYELVGELFAYCVRSDIPIPFYFTRMILAKILYTRIPADMSILYYLVDEEPEIVKSTMQMFKQPDNIEYAGLNINNFFEMVDPAKDEDVTANNYVSYLDKYSRHLHWKQAKVIRKHGKRVEYVPGNDTSKYLDAFVKGFHIKKSLRHEKVNVRQLDDLLSGVQITYINIMKWIENSDRYITYKTADNVYIRGTLTEIPSDVNHQQEIIKWFKEILNQGESGVPLAYMRANLPKKVFSDKKDAFVQFFMKLMHFWTSLTRINPNIPYTIVMKYNSGLPSAGTCSTMMYFPDDVTSKSDLYKRLITAVFEVRDDGFDMA